MQNRYIRFSHNCGFKSQKHPFNFSHFANLKFAHFEIEESVGLMWVKLQNWTISPANFHFGYLKGAHL